MSQVLRPRGDDFLFRRPIQAVLLGQAERLAANAVPVEAGKHGSVVYLDYLFHLGDLTHDLNFLNSNRPFSEGSRETSRRASLDTYELLILNGSASFRAI